MLHLSCHLVFKRVNGFKTEGSGDKDDSTYCDRHRPATLDLHATDVTPQHQTLTLTQSSLCAYISMAT